MSLYKQGEIWWYEFYVGKQRFRSSTRTTDKELAQKVETEHRESLSRIGKRVSPTLHEIKLRELDQRRAKIWEGVGTKTEPPEEIKTRHNKGPELNPSSLLQEAGELFLSSQRSRRVRRKTLDGNRGHLQRLVEFFGNVPLSQFTSAHFEHYQSVRGARCGASTVNHELNTLGRILRKVDLWYQIKRNYAPLKDRESKPPKIFTVNEQEQIFRALKENPNLGLGNIVFTITRNTTASGLELRGLRLKSLELEADPPRMHIPPDSTKNIVRPRTIPLNEAAKAACEKALERAKQLGSHYPDDYLFPLRIDRATWDPRHPTSASWLTKQIMLLRKVTGIPHINPHTFRHLAVTELLEKGASEQTVVALAGWVGRRMFETYSHPRLEAKAEAVQLLQSVEVKPPRVRTQTVKTQMLVRPTHDITDAALEALIERRVEQLLQQRLVQQAQIQATKSEAQQDRLFKSSTIARNAWPF